MKNIIAIFFGSLILSACVSSFKDINDLSPSRLPAQATAVLPTALFQNGDIIFHISQSRQSAAIAEVQKSPWSHVGILFNQNGKWFVYEAIQPVSATPVEKFIARSRDGVFMVKRLKSELVDMKLEQNQSKLMSALTKFRGQNYDLFFEWSDKSIYCSELVYKGYERAFGVKIGDLVQVKDLYITGPIGSELIKEREKRMGKQANLDEPIVTPASQYLDTKLETVFSNP